MTMNICFMAGSQLSHANIHLTTPYFPPGFTEPRVHRHDGVRLLLAVLHAAALRGRLPRRLQRDGAQRHGRHRQDRRRARVAPLHAAERRGLGGAVILFAS